MKPTIELEQVCYYSMNKENRDEDKLLLVKEQSDEGVKWIPLAKGWEYQLWHSIGERGGMAEAEEILLLQEGKVQNCTIEEYVRRFRRTLENSVSAANIFERFTIKVNAWRDIEGCDEFYIKKLEKDYKLPVFKEENSRIFYEKDITSLEELKELPIRWEDKKYGLQMEFIEN